MSEGEEELSRIMKEFGITDEARAYNAETMAAAAREAMPDPVKGGTKEPFLEHVSGYTHRAGAQRFYPIGGEGGGAGVPSWFVYSAISRAGMAVQDFLKAAVQGTLIDKLDQAIPGIANRPMLLAIKSKEASPIDLAKEVLNHIDGDYNFLNYAWKAGIGAGMGGAYSAAIEQFFGTGQLLYAYSPLQYQCSVVPRMRRYWNSLFTPSVPSPSMAWDLLLRGVISDKQFKEFASFEGWDSKNADILKELWKTLPNERTAFRMMMRGSIKPDQYKRYIVANGWDEWWADHLYDIYQWLPSARDAFRLLRRGDIKESDYKNLVRSQGFDPKYDELLKGLWDRIPLPHDAFNMLMRGVIGYKDWANYIHQNEWEAGADKYLYEIYQKLPSAREAFFMQRKGIIDIATRDILYKANGYDPKYHSKLTANYEYIPTLYDLTRIADYVEIDLIWATKVLVERGLRDRDIPKIIAMLKIRPLRNEITRQISLWLNRRMYGWISETEFETAIDTMVNAGYVQTTEKTLLLEEGQLKYEDELMREQIEILEWQFRTAVITQEQLEEGLLALGIVQEKVNLMVEVLLAQGYYGYY